MAQKCQERQLGFRFCYDRSRAVKGRSGFGREMGKADDVGVQVLRQRMTPYGHLPLNPANLETDISPLTRSFHPLREWGGGFFRYLL